MSTPALNHSTQRSLLADAWRELRRRKVVRAGASYAVVAWVVLQLAEITFEPLGLPQRALTWTILAAILGFPIVLTLAWYFDLGPGGLVRDRSPAARAGALVAVVAVLITVAAVGVWLSSVFDVDAGASGGSAAPANSIAVLPFADMSPQRDQIHLADGIAEELLDRLARNPALRVAARTSSFALRDRGLGVRELGELLGVRWVLEGSVRKAGGRLRITAQLIDADNGYHQWSETYEREDGDVFVLQDEVSQAITEQLDRQLLSSTVAADDSPPTAIAPETPNAEAYEAFLRGRQLWRERRPESLQEAEQLFRRAVDLDPNYARAWSGLADTYLLQVEYGSRPMAEAVQLAERAAVRAISLAPESGEAWASLGLLRLMAGQLTAAERSLKEAMRLDPRYEMAPMWLANVYGDRGDSVEQERVLRQARDLNPLEPVINSNLAQLLAEQGKLDEARDIVERLLAITPDHPMLLRDLAAFHAGRGDLAEAVRIGQRALKAAPTAPFVLEQLVNSWLLLQLPEQAEALLSRLPAESELGLLLTQRIALQRRPVRWLDPIQQRLAAMQPGQAASELELIGVSIEVAVLQGEHERAVALVERMSAAPGSLQLDHNAALLESLGAPLADASGAVYWQQRVQRWQPQLQHSAKGCYSLALFAAMAGDPALALQWLHSAVALGFRDLLLLRFDPRLQGLRGRSEFQDELKAVESALAEQRAQLERDGGVPR